MAKKKKAVQKKAPSKKAASHKPASKKATKPVKKRKAVSLKKEENSRQEQQRRSLAKHKNNHPLHDIVSALPLWLTKNLDLEKVSTVEDLQHAVEYFKSRIRLGFAEADRVLEEKLRGDG